MSSSVGVPSAPDDRPPWRPPIKTAPFDGTMADLGRSFAWVFVQCASDAARGAVLLIMAMGYHNTSWKTHDDLYFSWFVWGIPETIAVARCLQMLLQSLSTHPLCTASLSLWLVVMFWSPGPSVAIVSMVFTLCEKRWIFLCTQISRSKSRTKTATSSHHSSSCRHWWEAFVKAQRL